MTKVLIQAGCYIAVILLGMVLRRIGFFKKEDFSLLSNVRAAAPHASNEEIAAHLTELGLGAELKRPVRTLSGGMKRRVALVRAVLAPSKILLLDEPFKGLDEEMAKHAADYLLRHQNGRTVLLVTHEKEDAVRLSAETIYLPTLVQ